MGKKPKHKFTKLDLMPLLAFTLFAIVFFFYDCLAGGVFIFGVLFCVLVFFWFKKRGIIYISKLRKKKKKKK